MKLHFISINSPKSALKSLLFANFVDTAITSNTKRQNQSQIQNNGLKETHLALLCTKHQRVTCVPQSSTTLSQPGMCILFVFSSCLFWMKEKKHQSRWKLPFLVSREHLGKTVSDQNWNLLLNESRTSHRFSPAVFVWLSQLSPLVFSKFSSSFEEKSGKLHWMKPEDKWWKMPAWKD